MKQPITINIPGSKSISNRALILAVLSEGTTTLKNVAICDDTNFMIANLKKMGIKIQQHGTTVQIEGVYVGTKGNHSLNPFQLNFHRSYNPIHLYTGNAGTTTRFLTALATLTDNEIIIDGDTRMRERPISELIKALNQLGAKISSKNGCIPITIKPSRLQGGTINLQGNISSQYLSAILMISPFANGKTTINIEQKLCSKPYVEMTLNLMKKFGANIVNNNFRQLIIEPKPTSKTFVKMNKKIKQFPRRSDNPKTDQLKTLTVESDASSASYFGAYAALHSETPIFLQNIHRNSLQGDTQFLDYLERIGCKIIEQKNGTLVSGPRINKGHKSNLPNLKCLGTIDMNSTPDLVMTFAIIALFTKGKTRITNIDNLRIKETDRLAALENEINKLITHLNWGKNISMKTGSDWIEVRNNGLAQINRLKSPHEGEPKSKNRISQVLKQDAQNYRLESVLKNTVRNKSENSKGNHRFLKPITISTYNDHRIAMSFGILTDLIPNLKIENPSCVSKSYPRFWDNLKRCQRGHPRQIVLKSYTTHRPGSKRQEGRKLQKIELKNYTKIGPLVISKLEKNIVLTGLRGSGKSELGKILAEKITHLTEKTWNFVDLDEEIEHQEKTKIKNIIEKKGWEHFRKIERKICRKISRLKNTVISTGGGTIIDPDNKSTLKKSGIIIYLHVKPEICANRIKNDKNRPPLTDKKSTLEELKHLYKQRHQIYSKSAHIIFKRSDNLKLDATKIVRVLAKKITTN